MIPKIGDHIQDSLKYIPFSYLTSKQLLGTIHSQIGNGLLLQLQL